MQYCVLLQGELFISSLLAEFYTHKQKAKEHLLDINVLEVIQVNLMKCMHLMIESWITTEFEKTTDDISVCLHL